MSYIDITHSIGKAVDMSQPEFWKKRNEEVLTLLNKKTYECRTGVCEYTG